MDVQAVKNSVVIDWKELIEFVEIFRDLTESGKSSALITNIRLTEVQRDSLGVCPNCLR